VPLISPMTLLLQPQESVWVPLRQCIPRLPKACVLLHQNGAGLSPYLDCWLLEIFSSFCFRGRTASWVFFLLNALPSTCFPSSVDSLSNRVPLFPSPGSFLTLS
jgi:hypothetical protein